MWLRENDEVPCDLILIGTSDPQGLCYVEVKIIVIYFTYMMFYYVELILGKTFSLVFTTTIPVAFA